MKRNNLSLDLVVVGCAGTFDHILNLENLPTKTSPNVKHGSVPKDVHRLYFGGCSFNIAVTARTLGLRVAVINPVGHDFIQRGYKEYLEGHKISTEGLILLEETPSGHCYILQDKSGPTYMISYSLTDLMISVSPDPFFHLIERASHLVIAPVLTDFSLALGKYAKKIGRIVFLSSPITGAPNENDVIEMMGLAKVAFFNELEVNLILQSIGATRPSDLLKMGLETLVITRGSHGSILITSEGELEIPIVPARKVIDPTGAGDSFAAATSAALIKGYSPFQAVRMGAVVSSFVVEQMGCQTNLPNWETMLSRYQDNFGADH